LEKLDTTIKNFLNKLGLTKNVNQNKAIVLWDEVVGEKISKNTEAISVEHGILTVTVSNPTWRQELVFKQQEIIKQLNTKLGQNTIKEVRFI